LSGQTESEPRRRCSPTRPCGGSERPRFSGDLAGRGPNSTWPIGTPSNSPQLGQFDDAIGHAEKAVRIAVEGDHAYTLYRALFGLSLAHFRRRDLPLAARVLERCRDLWRTWHLAGATPQVDAALGVAYAIAGRGDDGASLVAGAVNEFRRNQTHIWPGLVLECAGMTYLAVARIEQADSHVQEALALTGRLGARGSRGPRALPCR
jgi:tetratricopeptide (TPR) repeat protein